MERFPAELLYALAFLAIILFNFIAQRAARRRAEQEEAQAAPAPPPAEEEELTQQAWGRGAAAPSPAPAPLPVPRLAPPPPAPPRFHPVRAHLKDKRNLRRAFVLVMVLGPCRARENHDDARAERGARPPAARVHA